MGGEGSAPDQELQLQTQPKSIPGISYLDAGRWALSLMLRALGCKTLPVYALVPLFPCSGVGQHQADHTLGASMELLDQTFPEGLP